MGTLAVDKLLRTSTGASEFTLPATDGTVGQVMQTDGAGQLSVGAYTIPADAVGSSQIATDAVTATEIAAGAVGTSEIAALAVTASEIAATTITPAQMADSAYLANRNMVINGAMQVAQRETSVAGISGATAGYHTVDRWHNTKTNCGTWTQTQDNNAVSTAGFGYSLKMDCTTALASLAASDRLMMSYRLEGLNCQNLKKGTASAESVTISFWVNATKTGTYVLELWDHSNSRHIASLYTVSVTNTWEKKTITFAGDTTGALNNTNAKTLELHWYLAAGSNNQSGTLATSWAATSNGNRAVGQVNAADSTSNNFSLAGVQMEIGSTATPYEHKNYEQELAACQRYYQKTYNQGIYPGANSSPGACTAVAVYSSGSQGLGSRYFTVMRTTPGITLYSPGGTSGGVSLTSDGSHVAATAGDIGDSGFQYVTGSLPSTNANGYRYHWTAEADM